MLRIVSWNVNSIRIRLESLSRLVAVEQPDVICLQEVKVEDGRFPLKPFLDLGYKHYVLNGIRAYHGTAIFSRVPLEGGGKRDWCEKVDGRHAFATLPGGIELHNFYIPAGGDIPDVNLNEKFAHKLRFLTDLAVSWETDRRPESKRIMLGDLNVAPLETDVWSHKQLLNVVSHTPIEVEHLARVQAGHDWVDAVRHFIPPGEKLYSWWSYRAADWAASDRGRRLDHVWVTPALAPSLAGARILREMRGWTQPSDHVAVVVDLA